MQQGTPRQVGRAVILAAGDGGRLATVSAAAGLPKPLVPLGGRPLVEYTLDAVAVAGAQEVLVVTGYREGQLRAALDRRPRSFDLAFVSNPMYERGASFSLRAARGFAAEEPFLLLMADHLLSSELLRRLTAATEEFPGEGQTLVAADGAEREAGYVAEATKLALAPGPAPRRVHAIGKGLARWDALDAGAFFVDPSAWEAVDAAPEDCELSAIFQGLAERGALWAADVSGAGWYDVDTPADLAKAAAWLAARPASGS